MSKLPPNGPMPILDPVNDGRHKLRNLPLERESIPYVIALPEQGIAAFVYTWVTKDNLAGSALAAYGPGIGDTPVFEAVDGIPMGPEKNFDNWQVGKLHLAQDLKLKTAKFGVVTDRVVIEANYEALHPAFAYSFHPDGCPAFAATDRLEQAGRVHGTIKVDGKAIAFDTFCARDHSWGTRDWGQPQHWKWLHAYNQGTQVHFWKIEVGGRSELRGYLNRDGQFAQVANVEVSFTTDARYHQKTISATVTDTLGRKVQVEGEYFATLVMPPVPTCTLVEGAMRCTIDGQAAVGWTEFMWPTDYLAYMASLQS
ncbi:hypothetical protein [uncultured Nevskia sp.]|uniref:DUF7064 domain-containing protein n=1 Tax=uncultured Nevskia sp. TaxID=228950 RepID=UPI002600F2A0|nr:hypothetical protein [uncultured Nevskia sp.]